MSSMTTAAVIYGTLVAAIFAGGWVRRLIPEHHLNGDSRDSVKL